MNKKRLAFRTAFPYTLPILAGFLFLGFAYGLYMRSLGFSALYPILMSATVFAGSMEFVAGNLLLGAFDPLGALLLTLMVNARHLFYGISMLEPFRGVGKKKFYLIFGLCDESFSINCATTVPSGIDKGWFYFFVTLLNQCYWVLGATLGGLFGHLVPFNTKGLDFVMTALFVVLFIENWKKEKSHLPSILGLVASACCLFIFGKEHFILYTMGLILLLLSLLKKQLDKEGSAIK